MKIQRIDQYIKQWEKMGYSDDIPDEVPAVLMRDNLAPSYKQIALCILSNDWDFIGLGFASHVSKWYGVLKSIEISKREKPIGAQMYLFDKTP